MKTYNWDEQLKIGKQGEIFVDNFFSERYNIEAVSLQTELTKGIDRVYIRKQDGKVFNVEIKTDSMASITGNMFAEFTVIYNTGREVNGWVRKSVADILIYYLPNLAVYCFDRVKLSEHILFNLDKYRKTKCYNAKLYSIGALVPLTEIEHLSTKYTL